MPHNAEPIKGSSPVVTVLRAKAKAAAKRAYARALWARVGLQVRFGEPPAARSEYDPPENGTLKTRAEWEAAVRELRRLGLPVHYDAPKNWDTLAALRAVLRYTEPTDPVLDAGAALYSTILPSLWRYGYQRLVGCNLEFGRRVRRGPAEFRYADLTATDFADASFGAITCLSVIEHGVDLTAYFKEAARLLRPGGVLVTSTDYFSEPIDTTGLTAYGQPVRIFTPEEITEAVEIARGFGLEPTGELDLSCVERTVTWKWYGLEYTFLVFTLRKNG